MHQVKRTLVDTLGWRPARSRRAGRIAQRVASRVEGDLRLASLGSSQRTTLDFAAFANTVLVRYLDCNDTYAARAPGIRVT